MKERYAFAVSLAILAISFLIFNRGWYLNGLFKGAPVSGDDLMIENAALKAELLKLAILEKEIPKILANTVPAFRFSEYPANLKNLILVSAGASQGVEKGAAVLVADSRGANFVLAGRVTEVFKDSSVVQTVFDSGFKIPVKIGKEGTDALFSGGTEPKLTLIAKKAAVEPGAAIISASADFPYGLSLGTVADVRLADDFWKEATLNLGYDWNSLTAVLISV